MPKTLVVPLTKLNEKSEKKLGEPKISYVSIKEKYAAKLKLEIENLSFWNLLLCCEMKWVLSKVGVGLKPVVSLLK